MSADYSDSQRAEQRLRAAANRLRDLVPEIAKARQVLDYSSDRRKNLLARYIAPLHPGKLSAVAAESVARSDIGYLAEFETLATQDAAAYAVDAEWRATQAYYEAARTLTSLEKEQLRQL